MHDSQNFLSVNRKYILGLLMLLSVAIISVAFSLGDKDNFEISRREVLLRRIGHEILLQSGDSTSRVLPIKKISANEYQISFENELTFLPDSLMNTTRRFLDNAPLSNNYIVNVLNCDNSTVTYGYAISKNKKDDIVSCSGRRQPKACYTIDIKFQPRGITSAKNGYILGSISFLAFVGFIFLKSVKQPKPLSEPKQNGVLVIGTALFDAKNKKIIVNESVIDLTGTETRLLLIFAMAPNEVVERSRLQKEIWEDEGVIVGRSLDMFISKLRKKLELDPNINIVVVRGKGYKLEVGKV